MNPRQRSTFFAIAAIALVWLVAIGGYAAFKNSRMTAEKLRAYLEQTNLAGLSGDARAKALRDLANRINALSPEERQKARLGHLWSRWFAEMTEDEKSGFIDATLPSGFKQMLVSFENMTPDRRKRSIDNALKRLRETPDPTVGPGLLAQQGTNAPPPELSEELQKKVAMIGLKSVYTGGSAQTKAELAPLLEELHKAVQSGRPMMGGR